MTKWIKCSEKKPPLFQYVLLYAEKCAEFEDKHAPHILVGSIYLSGDTVAYECAYGDGYLPFTLEEITHWMPLPEPPKD